jgi:uncharacterized protein YndB with AHSA1/START domain
MTDSSRFDSDSEIRRSVEFDLDADQLWSLLADPDELATWLGDRVDIDLVPGGAGRVVDDDVERDLLVEQVVDGERIAWRWWRRDDPGSASHVELVIAPRPGGTRLDIVETLIAPPVSALALDGVRWDLRATLMAIGAAATCLAR